MQKHQRDRLRPLFVGTALAVAAGGLTTSAPAAAAAGDTTCTWSDQSKTADQRARLLLDASSLQQKERWLVEQPANSPNQTSFTARGGMVTTYPVQVACTPTVVYTDGPDGIRGSDGVTAFPAQIALGATFNDALARDKGAAQGREGFDKGKNGVLGPGVSSGRTPLAGRTPEYFGEDSLLSGRLAGNQIAGIQSNPGVMSDLKHYVANEQELDRQTSSSNLDERTLHEVYQLPFEVANATSQPASAMCSYNRINGTYACENPLLTAGLRDELKFRGYTVSDFFAIHSTAPSLKAGLDQELNAPIYYTPTLLQKAVDAGQITVGDIDQAAFRVVRAYIAAGVFDHPLPTAPLADASTAAHKKIARQIAEQGSVLLKNAKSVLPLRPKRKQTIAVIGTSASADPAGSVNAKTVCSMGTLTRGTSLRCEDVVAPLDALRARAAENGAAVVYDPGTDPAAAALTAAKADVAIVFAYQKAGEFADLADLHLQGGGDALVSAVAAQNKKTIVVLETGSAVEMPWLSEVRGVVEAWYPGEQQGPALARLLFGDVDFSGRLPMTFPRSLADVPTSTPQQYPGVVDANGIRQVDYREGLAVGYKWYQQRKIAPLFPFGYGLSYSTIKYSNVKVQAAGAKQQALLSVAVTVRNTSKVQGGTVPQVYLTLPAKTGEPGSRLVGYQRVALKPGQSKRITFRIASSRRDHPLSTWSTSSKRWTLAKGRFTVSVRQDAQQAGSARAFTLR